MKKNRVLGLLTAAIVSVSIFTGCSSKSEEVKSDTNQEVNKEEKGTRVVSTLKGDVEIPVNPKRIADVSGSSEELVILGRTPVATADTDAYDRTKVPEYIKDKLSSSKIVGFSMSDTMDIEGIISTDPDLIIMSERQAKIYDQLKDIAPVVMIKDYANDWRAQLKDVAKLFGQEKDSEKWLAEYDKKAEALSKEILQQNGKKSYLTILASGGKIYIFSEAGIGSMLYHDMKLDKPVNLPKQEGISLPVVTMEGLSQIDSDYVIVIAADADKIELEKSTVWQNIRAVKAGNVVMLESKPYFSQSYNPIGKEKIFDMLKSKFIKK
jgi:iron complex transport system substrate-binding protein